MRKFSFSMFLLFHVLVSYAQEDLLTLASQGETQAVLAMLIHKARLTPSRPMVQAFYIGLFITMIRRW